MLTFDPKLHEYRLNGETLPSVTEMIKPCAYNINNTQPWDNRYKERGTKVHEATMLMDYGEEFFADFEIAGYLQAYGRFLKDYKPQWECIEMMGDAELIGFKYAGTIDRIGYIDGKLCILDIKTGQLHDALLTAQLTAYCEIAKKLLDGAFADFTLYGLKLSKDGTYKLKQYNPDFALLHSAIYIYEKTRRKK